MRFKRDKNGDWKIEARFGPEGMQRRHIGFVDGHGRRGIGQVYADVYLNYDSIKQVHRHNFLGSERAAKAWVRRQIEEAK